nr:hypothetical protein [Listeria grandensis]
MTRVKAAIASVLQIRSRLRREKTDIVHVHMAQDGSFFRKALLILQAKKECAVVLHVHTSQFDVFIIIAPHLFKDIFVTF